MPQSAADRLRNKSSEIIQRWQERAYAEVAATFGMSALTIQDALPALVYQVADALSRPAEANSARVARLDLQRARAQKHGSDRATALEYTLAAMIQEYHILRQVMFEVLEQDEPLSIQDRDLIVDFIDRSVNDAASEFAETQMQAQERLTLTLAHDLRNPISAAKSHAQLIPRMLDNPEQCQRSAEKINANLDRLEAMINELLDVSRLRAGLGMKIKLKDFQLEVLVKEVVEQLAETYGNRFIVHADEPVSGRWSPDGIRRIVENLAVNALKYGCTNSPITISLTQIESTVTLCVHNQGNPIPPEEQPKLFQKFLRSSTAVSQTGWGLGLALVKGMVDAHHGTVRVESSAEKGTDFIVELPRKPQE